MSRTRKGTKPPGWEQLDFGNYRSRDYREHERISYCEPPPDPWDDEFCDGCPICMCMKCGSPIVDDGAGGFRCYDKECDGGVS